MQVDGRWAQMGKKTSLFVTVHSINKANSYANHPLSSVSEKPMYLGMEVWLGLGMATVCLNHLHEDLDTCIL